MLQFWKTNLEKIVIHKVGNKGLEEGCRFSNHLIDLAKEENLSNTFLNFLLKPFKDLPSYSFTHPADLEMNNTLQIVNQIFDRPDKLLKKSKDAAKILYELSTHPKIKGGEFYVAYFSGCQYNDEVVDAIGLFKSENKDIFLNIEYSQDQINASIQEGINTSRLDKGCLVLNKEKQNGYIVFNIDNTNKSADAQYWKDEFLKLKAANDNFHFTQNFLSATKDFITNRLPSDFEVEKIDQIDYLNKSVNYFRENETFNIKDFEKNVFEDADIIKSFRKFGSSYLEQNDIDIADVFEISTQALKKQERIFKSVLKLDKNFHVYIHGRSDLLEKGYDNKKGKHYYKIYFDEEK
jgi:hypothetical protein